MYIIGPNEGVVQSCSPTASAEFQFVAVVNSHCREHWPPVEDGGGAASAEWKADRPVQLQPHRPAQPASAGVQPWPGAQQGASEGPGCLHRSHWQEGKQNNRRPLLLLHPLSGATATTLWGAALVGRVGGLSPTAVRGGSAARGGSPTVWQRQWGRWSLSEPQILPLQSVVIHVRKCHTKQWAKYGRLWCLDTGIESC